MLDKGETVKANARQRAVLERWKRKLGPRAFRELLVSMQPAMEYMDRERETNATRLAAGRAALPVERIVPIMPNEDAARLFRELREALRLDPLRILQ